MVTRITYAATVICLAAILAEQGASNAQKCESFRFTACLSNNLPRLKHNPWFYKDKLVNLNANCASLEKVFECAKDLDVVVCSEKEKRDIQVIQEGLKLARESLCDDNFNQSMSKWNRCLNRTIWDSCEAAYDEERKYLLNKDHLSRDEIICSYGKHSCLFKAKEGCPSQNPATEAVKNVFNNFLDWNDCPRFDGSSGRQRCDAVRFTRCFEEAMDKIKFQPLTHDDTVESLAEDCATARSVDSCTKYLVIEGCPDETKVQLRHLESDFHSTRSYICDDRFYESMLEWNRCLDKKMFDACSKEEPEDRCNTVHYDCLQNATTSCPPQSLAKKAIHHWVNTVLDKENCTRVEWNSGITPTPKTLLTLAALCISVFLLRF